MTDAGILNELLSNGNVFLSESIEINGQFAFLATTQAGHSIAVRHRDVQRSLLVRFLHVDPRQIEFQAKVADLKLTQSLITRVNAAIVRKCERLKRRKVLECPEEKQDAEVAAVLDLVPIVDPIAVTVPEKHREPFQLCARHIEPPFVAEVWPSCLPQESLLALGQNLLKVDDEKEINARVVQRRPNLNYHAKEHSFLELNFGTKSAYHEFLAPFRPSQGGGDNYVKGLRPLFRPYGDGLVRIDVFHSEFKAENRFLASKGLNFHSGCRLVNPRLVAVDESHDRKRYRGHIPSRLSKTCAAEIVVDDIIPDPNYIHDNSAVCYYHVGKLADKADSITCVVRRGQFAPVQVLAFTCSKEPPDLTADLKPLLTQNNATYGAHMFANETDLIKAFFDLITRFDISILVALDGLSHQMGFLTKRFQSLKAEIPAQLTRSNAWFKPELQRVKRESIHAGDKDYLWLNIPGRTQIDLMNCDRDLKLAVSNPFAVFDGLLQPRNKVEPGYGLMRILHGTEWPDIRVKDLPATSSPPKDPFRESVWTAVFCWLAEQDKRLLLELKQICSISNTPLSALIFQGDYLRVSNLLYLNTFPQWKPGQGDVESHSCLVHQVDLLRENWVAALDPDQQADKKAKAIKGEEEEELEPDLIDMFFDLAVTDQNQNQNQNHNPPVESTARKKGQKRSAPRKAKTKGKSNSSNSTVPLLAPPSSKSRLHVPFIRVEGGRVLSPKVGYYPGPIVLLDFAGLYPSIIRTGFDLATMLRTRAEAIYLLRKDQLGPGCIAHQNAVRIETRDEGLVQRENAAVFFVHDPSFDPKYKLIMESCTKLTLRRIELKALKELAIQEGDTFRAALYDSQQLATKKMNNSVYGVMKLVYPAFAGAITWKGRNQHQKMMEFACGIDFKAGGITWCDALYGDTDSIMGVLRRLCAKGRKYLGIDDSSTEELRELWEKHDMLKDPDRDLFDLFCERVEIRLAYFAVAEYLAKEYTKLCDAPMELECDGIMGRFNIIGKKMYTALLYEKAKKPPKIKSQGGPKRDRPACVRQCFAAMTERVCLHKDFHGALEVYSKTVDAIKTGDILFSDLFITREVTAKACRQENNLATKVISEFEAKTKQKVAKSGRLVFVAVTRDSKAQNDKFQEHSLAVKRGGDNISWRYYLVELANVISAAFGNLFGGSIFENMAYGQRTLPGQISGHATAKQQAKTKEAAKAKTTNKNKKKKTAPSQSNTLLSSFKPISVALKE